MICSSDADALCWFAVRGAVSCCEHLLQNKDRLKCSDAKYARNVSCGARDFELFFWDPRFPAEPEPEPKALLRRRENGAIAMRTRRVLLILCRVITGFGSFMVSLYGVYAWIGMGMQHDSIASNRFWILPLLSLPVFVLSYFRFPLSVKLHWALAVSYLIVFSALDWRTCSAVGYCQSVFATVLLTIRARPLQATFAVALFNQFAILLCMAQGRARARARAAQAS